MVIHAQTKTMDSESCCVVSPPEADTTTLMAREYQEDRQLVLFRFDTAYIPFVDHGPRPSGNHHHVPVNVSGLHFYR